MLMVGFEGSSLSDNDAIVSDIVNHSLGGVILFDYHFKLKKFDHNIKNPKQLAHLCAQLQGYAKDLPLFIGVDYEGGKVNRLKETYGFPPTQTAAALGVGSLEQTKECAIQMACALQRAGINLNFGPVLDLNVNPDNPIIGQLGRSFSSDVEKVVQYAGVFSEIYQEHGILFAYKHFPGHGSATADTHAGFVDISSSWIPSELIPFTALLKKYDCPMVMVGHLVNRQLDPTAYPASLSSTMITGLLRKELGYDGVVVTDDMQMKAITDCYGLEEALILAINAGNDLLIFGNQLAEGVPVKVIIDMIESAVHTRKIPLSCIDSAYERIVKLKKKLIDT
jgi:beta-N-acetylhexosaminidase